MSELLERERELAELDALVVEACAGAGRLAVIEATAGLGKTRLLQAASEAAAMRHACRACNCRPLYLGVV